MVALAGSLDANVLLRLLLNDLPNQHQSVINLFQNASGQFAVSDIAIIETVFVLERNYNFSRSAIVETIQGLMTLVEINCNQPLFMKSLPIFVRNTGLSFEDCCMTVYADLNDAKPLWTFDKKLAKQVSSAELIV